MSYQSYDGQIDSGRTSSGWNLAFNLYLLHGYFFFARHTSQ